MKKKIETYTERNNIHTFARKTQGNSTISFTPGTEIAGFAGYFLTDRKENAC